MSLSNTLDFCNNTTCYRKYSLTFYNLSNLKLRRVDVPQPCKPKGMLRNFLFREAFLSHIIMEEIFFRYLLKKQLPEFILKIIVHAMFYH